VASVVLRPVEASDQAHIFINGKPLPDYFPLLYVRERVLDPLIVSERLGTVGVTAHVHGGGFMAQAGAVGLAVARALTHREPDLRPALKIGKQLKRDPRMVERKKPGRAKARKRFQWSKR
jgi:small subunit ribosomal protein S9